MALACTKDFTITIDPEPTFQSLIWVVDSTLNTTFSGSKNRFDLSVSLGPASNATFHGSGGGAVYLSTILIPAVAQTRNCKFHLDVDSGGSGFSFVAGTTFVVVDYNQIAPAVPGTINAAATVNGAHDYAFVLNPGKAYNLRVTLDHQVQVFAGPGNSGHLNWTGYLYVESYS